MPATGARVELDLGGTWTDITDRVYLRDRIRITRGRHDQGSRVDPGSCSLTLNNKQGYFSPRNPMSPLYGQIGRNTPVRVSVPGDTTYLDLTGDPAHIASTPAVDALQIAGDLDVRAEVTADWRNPTTVQTIVGRYDGTVPGSLWGLWINRGVIEFRWHDSVGGNFWSALAAAPVEMPDRAAIRALVQVDNGAGGATTSLAWSDSITGTWTLFAAFGTTAGTYAVATGTTALAVAPDMTTRHPMVGRVHAVEVRDGLDGTVVVDVDFTAQTPGVTAFTDTAGLDWTVADGALTDRAVRFAGEVSAWPARWDVSGGDVYVPVQAAGIMRRLRQGASPLDSTLRRRIPSDPHLLAYWPMEEPQGATQAYSPLPGVAPMAVRGLTFGSDGTLAGSLPLPTVSLPSEISAPVPPPAAPSTAWHVEFVFKIPTAPTAPSTLIRVLGSGTVVRWQIAYSSQTVTVLGTDSNGATVINDTIAPIDDTFLYGQWLRQRLYVSESAGTVTYTLEWLAIGGGSANTTGTYTGAAGRVTGIQSPFATQLDGISIGHIAVFDTDKTSIFQGADTGFAEENAAERYARLTAEEGIPGLLPYGGAGAAEVGPQRPDTALNLLEEAAEADVGVLYEARERTALAYRPRVTLYNQAPALALDYTVRGEVAPPLEPTEDDTATVNDVTVSRPSGSSTRVTLDTGPLSTQAPPDGVGRYATSLTRNVQTDDQLPDLAAWLLHLGTVDEPRYPAITVNLAAGPWLRGDACTVDIGSVITITGLPVWLPPGDLTAMVQGYTETLGVYDWTITYNCTPASPWTVGVLGSTTRVPRAGTSGCTLGADVDADDTTLSLVTTTGRSRWIDSGTYAAEFPFDLLLGGGERVTCTAITGTGLTQSATVTRAVNGITRSWDTGTAVVLADPTYTAL